jgi:hypothetical protein
MAINKIPNSDIIGYEGPVGHEKAIHKTHFSAPGVTFKTRKNGDTKQFNGTQYVWRDGRWTVKETKQ